MKGGIIEWIIVIRLEMTGQRKKLLRLMAFYEVIEKAYEYGC